MMVDIPVVNISLCRERHCHSSRDLGLDLFWAVHILTTLKEGGKEGTKELLPERHKQ